jgi:heme peroxidase
MAWNDDEDPETGQSNIPVGYTYLSQFIAHELTSMRDVSEGGTPRSDRTPVFDLDSLYGDPKVEGTLTVDRQMRLGRTTADRPEDLPRTAGGEALIGDRRNDDNLPLAQTHVALLKFHNAVVSAFPQRDKDQIKEIVRQHFQSVVLHDYLARVIDPDVYRNVMRCGRAIFCLEAVEPKPFCLPIEFAVAGFRFGHSMIRNLYPLWNGSSNAMLATFWTNTHSSAEQPITQLDDDWVNKWSRLVWLPGQTEPPIMAAPINTRLASALGKMPKPVLPDLIGPGAQPSDNLAARTLLRGHTVRIKNARTVVDKVNVALAAANRMDMQITCLSDAELEQGEPDCVVKCLNRRLSSGLSLLDRTPLWFYLLKEAEVRGRDGRLGPLGSRIVMETIHAAIQFSPSSILRAGGGPPWKPLPELKPSCPTEYAFPHLIAFAATSNGS